MQSPLQVPHGSWVEMLPYIILSFLAGSLGWIKVWLNRKKPDADIHETESRAERTFAEARRIDADTSKSLGEVFVAMSKQLADAQQSISQERADLRGELEHKSLSEEAARVKSHKAIAEVQRCVMRIRDYEELMKDHSISFEKFEIKTYEQIMNGK